MHLTFLCQIVLSQLFLVQFCVIPFRKLWLNPKNLSCCTHDDVLIQNIPGVERAVCGPCKDISIEILPQNLSHIKQYLQVNPFVNSLKTEHFWDFFYESRYLKAYQVHFSRILQKIHKIYHSITCEILPNGLGVFQMLALKVKRPCSSNGNVGP